MKEDNEEDIIEKERILDEEDELEKYYKYIDEDY